MIRWRERKPSFFLLGAGRQIINLSAGERLPPGVGDEFKIKLLLNHRQHGEHVCVRAQRRPGCGALNAVCRPEPRCYVPLRRVRYRTQLLAAPGPSITLTAIWGWRGEREEQGERHD